jgi:hypothetical protein
MLPTLFLFASRTVAGRYFAAGRSCRPERYAVQTGRRGVRRVLSLPKTRSRQRDGERQRFDSSLRPFDPHPTLEPYPTLPQVDESKPLETRSDARYLKFLSCNWNNGREG